jgi:hypothetical protein
LTYTYSAFPGWNPNATAPLKNTTVQDQCDKNDKTNTNSLSENNNIDSNNQLNIFDNNNNNNNNIKINNYNF